jgi:hypothetical protein
MRRPLQTGPGLSPGPWTGASSGRARLRRCGKAPASTQAT